MYSGHTDRQAGKELGELQKHKYRLLPLTDSFHRLPVLRVLVLLQLLLEVGLCPAVLRHHLFKPPLCPLRPLVVVLVPAAGLVLEVLDDGSSSPPPTSPLGRHRPDQTKQEYLLYTWTILI